RRASQPSAEGLVGRLVVRRACQPSADGPWVASWFVERANRRGKWHSRRSAAVAGWIPSTVGTWGGPDGTDQTGQTGRDGPRWDISAGRDGRDVTGGTRP